MRQTTKEISATRVKELREEVVCGSLQVPIISGQNRPGVRILHTHVRQSFHLPLQLGQLWRATRVGRRPVLGRHFKHFIVLLVLRGHHRVLRVVRLGRGEECLQ